MRSPAYLDEDDGPSTSAQAAARISRKRRYADEPLIEGAAGTLSKRRHLNEPEYAAVNIRVYEILPDVEGLREVVGRLTPEDKVVVLTFDEVFTKPETTYSAAEDRLYGCCYNEEGEADKIQRIMQDDSNYNTKIIAELKDEYLKDGNLAKCRFWLNKGVLLSVVAPSPRYPEYVIPFYDNVTPPFLRSAVDAKVRGGPKIMRTYRFIPWIKFFNASVIPSHRYTPARCMALNGNVEMMRYLIEHSAPIDLPCLNKQGPRPIHWACRKGHAAVVQVMLQAGINVNAADFMWLPPHIY
uniref:Uncharacterized protein n=1 Tax=Glossina palpalis gambiensis TaxID=67801 RepID=A0A1B0APU2_9MUSC